MHNRKRTTAFKMAAAAAMFEIQVNALNGQLSSYFDKIWYTDKEKHALPVVLVVRNRQ
jgi:hypothetical protein